LQSHAGVGEAVAFVGLAVPFAERLMLALQARVECEAAGADDGPKDQRKLFGARKPSSFS
jgi:hypothetical protein